MGFLLGAFGKLSAGRRKRDIQSQLMRVQTRLRRASKDVANMDKQLQKAEQAEKNQLKAYVNQAKAQSMSSLYSALGIDPDNPNLAADQSKTMQYTSQSSLISANADSYYAMLEQQIADKYENLRDTQLEPLKQEEELLQTEQEQLQSQLQLAEQDYEACKQMEKDGAKNLKPEYTAGS